MDRYQTVGSGLPNCSKEHLGSTVTETLKKPNFDTNIYIKIIEICMLFLNI